MNPDLAQKFKFKHIKFHSSKIWLNGSQRRYRKVFYAPKVSFMYFELALWNKLFDRDIWEAPVTFKGFDSMNHLLFTHPVKQVVNKTEDIVYVRSSWGVKDEGAFWTKGTYRIEAWMDDEKIGEDSFIITDSTTPVIANSNPWFELRSIRVYEGTLHDVKYGERQYLNTLNALTTRYIYIEVEAENLFKETGSWPCEFIIRIKNELDELVAEIYDFITYTSQQKIIRFSRGWGSDNPGTWFEGEYKIELIFLDNIIGIKRFSISDINNSDEDSAGFEEPDVSFSDSPVKKSLKPQVEKVLTEEEIMKEINELIGLESIKSKIKELYEYVKYIQVRKNRGLEGNGKGINIHAVFTGNPGTGKTVTAKLLGKIFHNLGILSKGHVFEVDRTVLVGEFIGHTAPKTKAAIDKARGGILFIDEAYSLARADSEKDFGREALEIIIKEMSDGPGDICIICAGYPMEMNIFINSNPGLKSRFNHYFNFPDYNPTELLQIGKYTAGNREVKLSAGAEEFLYKKLVESYRDRDRTFGNARFVNSIIEESKMNLAVRIIDDNINTDELDEETLCTITDEDMKEVFRKKEGIRYDIPVDEELLHDSINELNMLVGIDNIKEEISDMVKLVRYYKEIGKDVRKVFSLHSIFTGNPGTGKTTVARIFARIFRSLGIIERGHLVEADRESLVAGFVGQTAIKTNEKIEQAMGGVLFIDEAYALNGSGGNDFGSEAIEILLKRMEDKRGEFIVICAGYTDNMEEFLKSNPGLKSRFDKKFHFNDYNDDELFRIAEKMFIENDVTPDEKAVEHLRLYIRNLCTGRDKFFGNAREIRKAVDVVIKNQNLRLAGLSKEKRTKEMIHTITIDDVLELKAPYRESQTFGFKP